MESVKARLHEEAELHNCGHLIHTSRSAGTRWETTECGRTDITTILMYWFVSVPPASTILCWLAFLFVCTQCECIGCEITVCV